MANKQHIENLKKLKSFHNGSYGVDIDRAVQALKQEQKMVHRETLEQVMWERDVAIEQLKELGYGLGEKPKTGHWIYDRTRDWDGECKYECSECGMGSDVDYPYCMRCGCRMVEQQERSEE